MGVNFVVGSLGAVETAKPTAWESTAVFGVSGGVGGAVRADRARPRRPCDRRRPGRARPVLARRRSPGRVRRARRPADVGAGVVRHTAGRGADVVYDAVGGVTTPAALASLAHRGRLVVISSVGTRTVEIGLLDLYHDETRILGCDSRRLDATRSSTRLGLLRPFFERGRFLPLPVAARYGLTDGKDACTAVVHGARGRVVVCP